MSIFGSSDRRYKDFFTAFIHSYYNIAFYDWEVKTINNFDQFIWIFINSIAYYWITSVFIVAISTAIVRSEYDFCEKSGEFPAVKEDGTWDKTEEGVDFETKLK